MMYRSEIQSPMPLYKAVGQKLRQLANSGEIAPGGRIPAETALMRDYQVSRITVRSAVQELVEEGVLV